LDGGEYPVEVRARDEEDDTPADPVAATLPDVDAYAVDDYDFDTDDDHDDEEGILPTEGKRKRRKTGKAVAERAGDTESVDWKFLDGSEPKQDPRAMRRRRSRKKRQRN